MKSIALIISISLTLIGCTPTSKKDLILGKWEISTWTDSRNNSDLLKTDGAPHFSVRFEKDTVYILELEEDKSHDYKFKWEIKNDSLKVGSLGTFEIAMINREKCILNIKTRPIFKDEMEFHTETLTLIK